ncbi:hypothetical protein CYMTET_52923 [Cymbomonas tetramitiformis]|uniref:Uncharacterized protein n=1 Tax=Cymbomonas tetramitiformis TaxID=36881 RepID=A0AAE0BJ49_9CHLO|nr:hypothetical protein CYMTET_52923 [Cymbomonas tetramitiformis]
MDTSSDCAWGSNDQRHCWGHCNTLTSTSWLLIAVILKSEFGSAGLDLASFDRDEPDKKVTEKTFQEVHSHLRYPARVDPLLPLIAKEQRLLRDDKSEDWAPTESTRKANILERIDPEFYAAVRGPGEEVGDVVVVSPMQRGGDVSTP